MSYNKDAGEIAEPDRQVKAEDQKRVEEPGQHRDGHDALMDEKKFETISGLAVILLVADIPIQAVLMKASFPNMSLVTALLLGAAFAFFIGMIGESAVFLAAQDGSRPQGGIQKALWLACGTSLVSLVAGSILLYARSATEVSAEFVSVTNAALWALSEGMGLTAGFLSAARRIYKLGAIPEERGLAS